MVEQENEWVTELKQCEKLLPILESETLNFSSVPLPVNDAHAEYQVSVVKHFFDSHVVLQYSITNTIEDHRLSNVRVVISNLESPYKLNVVGTINLSSEQTIFYSEKRYVYVLISKAASEHPYPIAKIK